MVRVWLFEICFDLPGSHSMPAQLCQLHLTSSVPHKGLKGCRNKSVQEQRRAAGEQTQEPLQQRASLWVNQTSSFQISSLLIHQDHFFSSSTIDSSSGSRSTFKIMLTSLSRLPDDSSRVKLSIIQGSPYDDYINANYMPVRTDSLSHSSRVF